MRFECLVFFFFQAEDGIRDLVRSRGLGDVYKRQVVADLNLEGAQKVADEIVARTDRRAVAVKVNVTAVSYTHLTLPTSDLV